jgi:hypothetical protein
MRRLIYFVWLTLLASNAYSQKRDNVWMLGTQLSGNNVGLEFFNSDINIMSSFHALTFFITDASICDTAGNLLFYTNGTYIANKNHDTLYNSKDFNPGYLTDVYYEGLGLGMPQGAIVLPVPQSSTNYIVVYMSGEEIESPSGSDYVTGLELRYSEIDMALDGGLGGISIDKKKEVLVTDTMTYGQLTACKHANGRDWWIISHKYYSNKYYKFLLTPEGILGPYSQHIGSEYRIGYFGKNVFSPDGSKLAHVGQTDTLDLFNFDRCTGELSNNISFRIPDSIQCNSCEFSASGRFLYVATLLNVFQYDMWANNIEASAIKVAEYDSVPGFPLWFGLMQLAPDNKIYISTYSGSTFLHKIDKPDSLGIACSLVQSGVLLPSYNSLSLPNFPNYDLGPLQGSPCDTLYLVNMNPQERNVSFRISPNPSVDWFNIVYDTDHNISATIYDAFGREVKQFTLYPWFKNRIVYVDDLLSGVYFLTLRSKTCKQTLKLIVAK